MTGTWIVIERSGFRHALRASAVEHVQLQMARDGIPELVSIRMVSGEYHSVADDFDDVLAAVEGTYAVPLTAIP